MTEKAQRHYSTPPEEDAFIHEVPIASVLALARWVARISLTVFVFWWLDSDPPLRRYGLREAHGPVHCQINFKTRAEHLEQSQLRVIAAGVPLKIDILAQGMTKTTLIVVVL